MTTRFGLRAISLRECLWASHSQCATLQSGMQWEYRALAGEIPARFFRHDILLFHLLESL
jgi:hypothetical protein